MSQEPEDLQLTAEQANQEFHQTIMNHIHPKAKNLPLLYNQIVQNLERYKPSSARTWSAHGMSKRFQRFFDATEEEAKPELASYLAAKAARAVLGHRDGDLYAQHVSRRYLDEWAEGQLRAMAAENQGSPKPTEEGGAKGSLKLKIEPVEWALSDVSQHEKAEVDDSEPLAAPAPQPIVRPKTEPARHVTPPNRDLLRPLSTQGKRQASRSGMPRPKRPRMVDEGCLAKVDYRDSGTQTDSGEKDKTRSKSPDLKSDIEALVDAAIARRSTSSQETALSSMVNSRVALVQDTLPARMITELSPSPAMQYPAESVGAYGRVIPPSRRPEPGYMPQDMWDAGHGRGQRGDPYGYPGPEYGSMMDTMWAFGRVGYRR
ncbi:unnamed protein product [Clonostachys chloroleuca]|uniref:Uncharacterized protein n=1 Tax=Clonostachys chloroleuca TaxID=1926264 RepID=A0AA35Q2I5_9HYPO|nr:unnamed protein product [Clonostachys chloroleuca]